MTVVLFMVGSLAFLGALTLALARVLTATDPATSSEKEAREKARPEEGRERPRKAAA